MLRFHRGVARLSLSTKAPVIPVGLWGTQQRWPRSGRRYGRPWRPRLAFVFGDAVAPAGDPTDPDDLAAFTQRVREAIEVQVARAKAVAGAA
jgi:1-acyl-sn-glycerol-3-phosphate acyltransferase